MEGSEQTKKNFTTGEYLSTELKSVRMIVLTALVQPETLFTTVMIPTFETTPFLTISRQKLLKKMILSTVTMRISDILLHPENAGVITPSSIMSMKSAWKTTNLDWILTTRHHLSSSTTVIATERVSAQSHCKHTKLLNSTLLQGLLTKIGSSCQI